MSTLLEEDGGWTHDDTLELLGLSPAKLQAPPLARTHGGSDLEPTVMEETSLASLAAARSGSSSAAGSSDEGDQAVEEESMVMRDRSLEDIVLENRSQTKLKSVSSSGTGSSTEIDQLIGNQEPVVMEETSLASLVAARSQTKPRSVSSSAKGSSTEIDQVAGNQEPIVMEERSLAAARSQTRLQSASGSAEGSSTEIDQLISEIKDPELDSSLEDIAAMINSQESNATEDNKSPTPVFTTAATMIDQNPDQGFDPNDPAVKKLEDWECSSLPTSEQKNLKIPNVLKRFSRHQDTDYLLNEDFNKNVRDEKVFLGGRKNDLGEKESVGRRIGATLLYIFLKIFD